MASFLEDLQDEVRRYGVNAMARNGFSKHTVGHFLRDPMSVRLNTFSRLATAAGMPHGEFHLISIATNKCMTCKEPRARHYPLLPESNDG